jgi:hypothetical protein
MLHPPDYAPVDLRIFRYIAHLTAWQWPPNRPPRAIRLKVHPSEWQVLHEAPDKHIEPVEPIAKFEAVMEMSGGAGEMQGVVEGR